MGSTTALVLKARLLHHQNQQTLATPENNHKTYKKHAHGRTARETTPLPEAGIAPILSQLAP